MKVSIILTKSLEITTQYVLDSRRITRELKKGLKIGFVKYISSFCVINKKKIKVS